ncbi:MAG: toll/interleukin-1 receptor domain-containing protein [Saprospiraceae bacterium]|nr:toll/interleukin-1 receptor domain-containing protein [Saprospiraceae bacterium]
MKDVWQFYSNLAVTAPKGMKVSLDNNYFVKYSNVEENSINIESEFIIEAKNSESKIKSIKTYLFNPFLDKTMKSPLKIFLSYAHEDFKIKERVLTYLKPLLRENKVEIWHDSMIRPGDDWDDEVQTSLDQCDIYLLLISPDSIASDYIIFKELQLAYQKNKKILGFLLSDCDWLSIALKVESDQKIMLGKIQIFPRKTDSAISPKTDLVALSELLALELFSNVGSAYMQIVNELKIIYDK